MNMNLKTDVAKKLRNNKGWSQQQLAEICNVSLRTIQRLENTHTCSLETLNALLAAFGVSRLELEAESQSTPNKQKSLNWLSSLHIPKVFYYAGTLIIGFFLLTYSIFYSAIINAALESGAKIQWFGASIVPETAHATTNSVVMPPLLIIALVVLGSLLFGVLKKNQWAGFLSIVAVPSIYLLFKFHEMTLTPVSLFFAITIGYVLYRMSLYIKSLRELTKGI
ncbi:helix-turn-helix domain-containing protein [Pleionea sp. CnH1-48]|uniref:helix-turn-helix domain-containing protein n=1 Tax=Pleionea sp. CnH1-48 TaxID=2954494 RepID=UPI00209859F2|nr:helix-turn-helix transcriptional regulator [Pleionea sp. CnH1-48]MCO7224746.1 helix-turn-helix domain-containing protein [Pleionea sp. CnH1-48]